MRKILCLVPLPPPYYGAAVISKECVNILKESGIEVEIVKLNCSKEVSDIGHFNFAKIKGFFYTLNQIRGIIKNSSPDLAYVAPATSSYGFIRDFIFVRELKKANIPIIFHLHSRIARQKKTSNIFNGYVKKMFCNEKAIVLGKELLKDVQDYVSTKDIFCLPNSIKNEVSNKQLATIISKRKKKPQCNFLFLSNMDSTKGWPKVLKACKILCDRGLNFSCNFVGAWTSSKNEADFNNFVKNNSLEKKVFYLGRKTGEEKNKILSKSDVLVFPTEYKLETFGVVILEAMMFGIPVVANSIATIPSTIQEGKTGFLLSKNTPEEIADKLEFLIKNPSVRYRMGLAGRKRFLNNFEIKFYRKKFLEIFKKILPF